MSDLAPKEKLTTRTAPPKRWRNLWHNAVILRFTDGTIAPPGISYGTMIHPTKDIAEEYAAKWLRYENLWGDAVKYLGAEPIPDGE